MLTLTDLISSLRTPQLPVRTLALIVIIVPAATGAMSTRAAPAGVSCGVWSIVPAPKSSSATAYLNGAGGTSDRDV